MQELSNISDRVPSSDVSIPVTEPFTGNWMPLIFGFTDGRLLSYNDKRRQALEIQQSVDYNWETGRLSTNRGKWNAGFLVSPSVQSIMDSVHTLPKTGQPVVVVVQGKDASDLHMECNDYETIQAASQFNALEMVSPEITPLDGIEIYAHDNTQGPVVAMACAPGTFVRNYLEPLRSLGEFNSLADIKLNHVNGYLQWRDRPQDIVAKLRGNQNKLLIPSMIYTQVAGVKIGRGSTSNELRIIQKRVHQIYTSSVPVNAYGNGGDVQMQLEIARTITKASYMGAIGMSILMHSIDMTAGRINYSRPRVNLTLIGAGAFNVPIATVLSSLREAIDEFKGYAVDITIHAFKQVEAQSVDTMVKGLIFSTPTLLPPTSLLTPPTLAPQQAVSHTSLLIPPTSLLPPTLAPQQAAPIVTLNISSTLLPPDLYVVYQTPSGDINVIPAPSRFIEAYGAIQQPGVTEVEFLDGERVGTQPIKLTKKVTSGGVYAWYPAANGITVWVVPGTGLSYRIVRTNNGQYSIVDLTGMRLTNVPFEMTSQLPLTGAVEKLFSVVEMQGRFSKYPYITEASPSQIDLYRRSGKVNDQVEYTDLSGRRAWIVPVQGEDYIIKVVPGDTSNLGGQSYFSPDTWIAVYKTDGEEIKTWPPPKRRSLVPPTSPILTSYISPGASSTLYSPSLLSSSPLGLGRR